MNCRWLQVRVRFDRDTEIWCEAKQQDVEGPILFREACGLFERMPERVAFAR